MLKNIKNKVYVKMINNVHKYMMLCFVLSYTTLLFAAVGNRIDEVRLPIVEGVRFDPYKSVYAQNCTNVDDKEYPVTVRCKGFKTKCLAKKFNKSSELCTDVQRLDEVRLSTASGVRFDPYKSIYAQNWQNVADDQEQQPKVEYKGLPAKCLDNQFLHTARLKRLQQLHQQYGNAIFFMTNYCGQTPIEVDVCMRRHDMNARISYMVDHLPADDLKSLLLTPTGRYNKQVLDLILSRDVLEKIFNKCPELQVDFETLQTRCLDNEFLHTANLQKFQQLHQKYGNAIFFMTNDCGQTPIEVTVCMRPDDMDAKIVYMVDQLPADDLKSLLLTRTGKHNEQVLDLICSRNVLEKIFNKCPELCTDDQKWKNVDDNDQEQQVKKEQAEVECQALQAKCLNNNFLHFATLKKIQRLHQRYGNVIFFMTNDCGQTPIEVVVCTRPNDMYDKILYMVDHLPADDLKLLLLTRTGKYKMQVLNSIYSIHVLAKIFDKCPELSTKGLAQSFSMHKQNEAASFIKTRAVMGVASKEGCAKH